MNANYYYIYRLLKKLKFKKEYFNSIINQFKYSYYFYEKIFNKKSNILTGGGEIEIKKEILKFKEYEFSVRTIRDTINNNILIKIYSKLYGICLLLVIDDNVNYAQLENLSNFPDCANNKIMPYKGGGKLLLNIALNFLRLNYQTYKKNRIVLADNSHIDCIDKNRKKNKIYLSLMSTLKYGHTWYGMYGFRPYDDYHMQPDFTKLKAYKENYDMMHSLKLKNNSFIIKKILEQENKYKYGIINDDIIRQIINNDKEILIKDFFQRLFKINNFCVIFEKIYKDIARELKLYDFTHNLFYLDFKI